MTAAPRRTDVANGFSFLESLVVMIIIILIVSVVIPGFKYGGNPQQNGAPTMEPQAGFEGESEESMGEPAPSEDP